MSTIVSPKIHLKKNQDRGQSLCNIKSFANMYNGSSPDFQIISPRIPINDYFLNRNYISSRNSGMYTIPLPNANIDQENLTSTDVKRNKSTHTNSEPQFDFSINQLLKQRRLRNESISKLSCQNTIDSKDMTICPTNNTRRQLFKYSIDTTNTNINTNSEVKYKRKKFLSQNFNKIELTQYLTYLTSVDADTDEEKFRKRLNQDANSIFSFKQNNISILDGEEESLIYDSPCLKLIAMKTVEKKTLKHLKSLNYHSEKNSEAESSPKSPNNFALKKLRNPNRSKTKDFNFNELDNLVANYKIFYENVAQFKCSEVSFRRILGDSELINHLFASKIKGRFKEPPTSMKLIEEILEFYGKKRVLPRQKKPYQNLKNKYSLIDSYSLEILRKFCYKLGELNIEWKMNGIKNLDDRLFCQQESQRVTEKKILPKIFKTNKKQFYDILEMCDSQHSQILPSIDYNIRNKLTNTERVINSELDLVEKANRVINNGLDEIYEKCQLNYYKSNTGRIITLI